MVFHIKKFDWILNTSVFILITIGIIFIYSSSIAKNNFENFQKQILFFIIGIFLMFFLSFVDCRFFCENSIFILVIYFFCVLALLGLFFFAPSIRGIKAWYKLGSISLDPIEFTKIVLVILLAKYFSMRHVEMYKIIHILISGFYIALPAFLIFLQPNLGSALVLGFLWIGILLVSGIKLRHFFILVLCGLILFALGWSYFLKDYQKERIMSFLQPEVDPLGMSWSQNQAKIAIGSGGIFGQGFTKGSQTQHGFLPEPQTDFIFSVIAEEWGLLGVTAVFALFLIIIWRIIQIGAASQGNFPRFFSVGFSIVLIFQAFIHVGMNLGILPIIGVPLPLVSYGGSGLIAALAGLGILQSIKNSP